MRTSAPGRTWSRGGPRRRRGLPALAAVIALTVAAGCGTADSDDTTPPEDLPTTEAPDDGEPTETDEAQGTTGTGPADEDDPAGDAGAGQGDADTGGEGAGGDAATGGDDDGGAGGDDGEQEGADDRDAGGDDGDGGNGDGGAGEDLSGFVDPGTREESEPGGYDLVVTGIRTGVHTHYERVVLDVEGGSDVGWFAEYSDDPAMDGSGAPVALAGDGTLVVIVRGVEMPMGEDHPYDPGQLLVQPDDTVMVTEILRTAPFEGQLQVFIGTQEEVAYRIFRLGDPERLVIDVMTH